MTETEVLRAFFQAWEQMRSLKGPGRPSAEYLAAVELMEARAKQVREWKPQAGAGSPAVPAPDPALAEYRRLNSGILAIEPKSTHNQPAPKGTTIAHG